MAHGEYKITNGYTIGTSITPDPKVMQEINRIDLNVMTQHGDLIAVAAIALGVAEKDIERFGYLATASIRKWPNMTISQRYQSLIELAFQIKTGGV